MRIDWIIPCRYAEIHQNLGTIVGAGIDTFTVPALPAHIEVAVVVRLLAMPDELRANHEHTSKSIVTDPTGSVVSEHADTFSVSVEHVHEEWLTDIMHTVVVRFEAAGAGTHNLEYVVDGHSVTVPLRVVDASQSA